MMSWFCTQLQKRRAAVQPIANEKARDFGLCFIAFGNAAQSAALPN